MEHRRINFLPEEEVPHAVEPPPRKRSWLFLLLGIFALAAIGIGAAALALTSTSLPNEPEAYDPVTLEPKPPQGLIRRISDFVFSKDIALEGEKNDRINILLMGMGGAGHDGPYLTDTIIIASVRPSDGEVAMVSIPRDLGVEIPGYGTKKINHANAFGENKKSGHGGEFATQVISDIFDTDIQYFIRVDFKAFEHIINDVGGISVDVERSFTDEQYPAENHLYQTVSFKKGITKMDGETALKYARSRHGNNGEGSDFSRARRQQKVILALKEKVLSFSTLSNPIRIHSVYSTLADHISTNMEFSDIIAMIKLAKSIQYTNIKNVVLDSSPNGHLVSGQSSDGAYILQPKTGSFDEIKSLIANVFSDETIAAEAFSEATPVQEAPKLPPSVIEIQNGTWRAGLAARVGKALQNKGISAKTIGNTQVRPQITSGIYKMQETASIDTMQALRDELKISIKQTPPDGIIPEGTTDILIVLGEDYEE